MTCLPAFVALGLVAMANSSSQDIFPATQIARGQECLAGTHHAPMSYAAASNFTGVCSHYRDNSCCTSATAQSIETHGDRQLYGFYLDDCGPVHDECYRYLKQESCFYECDPYLQLWTHPTISYSVHRVPVCAGYCSKWYEACRNVSVCTDDFVNGFVQNTTTSRYDCPAKHTCRTFEQWYGSAKAMCDRQWGTSFFYTEDSNCFTMGFTGHNPNACVRSNATSNHNHLGNCQVFNAAATNRPASTVAMAFLTAWLLASVMSS